MPTYQVNYEWVMESVDADGDIHETEEIQLDEWFDRKDYVRFKGYTAKLSLRRLKGCDEEGEVERGYAEVVEGKLEERFDSGQKVPEFLNKQLYRFILKHGEL